VPLNRALAWVCLAWVLAGSPDPGLAQPAQDAIDRSQQERAVRERDLRVRLDGPRAPPQPLPPEVLERSIVLPTPGTEILQRQPPPRLPPRPTVAKPAAPVIDTQKQLDDSQRRRQLEAQVQLPAASATGAGAEDVGRQRALQVQRLQFEREQRAQQLGSDIMRGSDRAMGR
jgi:hypothetical protein